MESETGIALVVFGVVLLALGMYIYILTSGSNEALHIIQQICDSSVGQTMRTIIPDTTATCQKINIEAQASLIGIELG
jgi:hypothetical protein